MINNHKKICKSCSKLVEFNKTCDCQKGIKKLIENKNKRIYNENNKEEMKFFNSKRWKKVRQSILSRDKYHCVRCKELYNKYNHVDLQVHHIKSRKNFPDLRFDEDNLLTLCKDCNLKLGTSDKLDFELEPTKDVEYFL